MEQIRVGTAGGKGNDSAPGRGRWGRWAAALVLTLCLLPFVNKALNIDDPLFVRSAQRITQAPADFYGLEINWDSRPRPLKEIFQNPPLTSYWLALWASVAGWSEISLHAAMLVWAVALGLGMHALASLFCTRPALAAVSGALTPVVLVSASMLMCDVMMLALWVWAAAFWVRGVRGGRLGLMLLAALLTALCGLSKYFGISLVPLLTAYSLLHRRGLDPRLLVLALPLAAWAAYDVWTAGIYGHGLLIEAMDYADSEGHGGLRSFFVGLAFTGGCLLPMLAAGPCVWGRRGVVAGFVLTAVAALVILGEGSFGNFPQVYGEARMSAGFAVQAGLCITAGVHVLAMALVQASRERDADTAFLVLWVVGVVLFASQVNWSVNGRSLLPLAPAAAVLLVRGAERRGSACFRPAAVSLYLCLALALSLSSLWAEYRHAESARWAAQEFARRLADNKDDVRFQGHWGFQHYMEAEGFVPLDQSLPAEPGWIVLVPENNTNVVVDTAIYKLEVLLTVPAASWVTLVNVRMGAGFHAEMFGPLPLVFGRMPLENYFLFRVVAPAAGAGPPGAS